MSNAFFERPILNSPYERPTRYWELDASGQPTLRDLLGRRPAEYVTPIPKPRKRKKSEQAELELFSGDGISDEKQKYDPSRSSTNSASPSASGAVCPAPSAGASFHKPPVCSSTGGSTSSPASAPFSARAG